jgi:N-acetylglucosamine-6-phosphate deacetylase
LRLAQSITALGSCWASTWKDYISAEDGMACIPASACLHPRFDALYRLAEDGVLQTLAPAARGAGLIRHASLGVVVSLGHTLADSQTVQQAVQAGACASTHLGNGLPALVHRHYNPLWSQLAQPNLSAMLITDGHHLPGDFVRTVLAAKG